VCILCVCVFAFDLCVVFIVFIVLFVCILFPRHKSHEYMKIGPHPRGQPLSLWLLNLLDDEVLFLLRLFPCLLLH
jgi:hypothetical protein